MTSFIDLSGKNFGRLSVSARAGTSGGFASWHCRCQCGKETVVRGDKLRSGSTVSCGCFGASLEAPRGRTHGMTKSGEWSSWNGMKRRCLYSKCAEFKRYGGRGIKVCDRWLNSFVTFLEDMGPKPSPQHSLDRYPDRDGNYEPSNCRWATSREQADNKDLLVGSANPAAKFTEAVVRQILLSEESARSLAKKLGVSKTAVLNVRRRKTWSHIAPDASSAMAG